jgi:N-acylneuraminate cytidylyltransferase
MLRNFSNGLSGLVTFADLSSLSDNPICLLCLYLDNLIANRNIIGKKPLFISTSDVEAIDIDTPLDFFVAEQIYIRTVLETKGLLD